MSGSRAGDAHPMSLRFRWVADDSAGDAWGALLERAWPSYRRWFLRDGEAERASLEVSKRMLAKYMPELMATWERLAARAAERLGSDQEAEVAARMLALYRPPAFLTTGCSQAVWTRERPALVRNYDYHPSACEGTFVLTDWLDTRALASSDCLWGALDGLNEHGLAVALSFGGRPELGDGFGIPLIVRYVLQLCRTVGDAAGVLARVPSHMSYNVSLLDRSGAHLVAYLRPGHDTVFVREPACTNHQGVGGWTAYARKTRSVQRKRHLRRLLHRGVSGADELVAAFLAPPLYLTDYARGHGTLYTVAYHPLSEEVDHRWPGACKKQSIRHFQSAQLDVAFTS